jgi:hypothetical protein
MTYKQYRRTAVAEMMDWHPSVDMTGVSISEADRKAGSPRPGDKIARNPANHDDRWLVAADYFAANFEQAARAAAPAEPQQPVAWMGYAAGFGWDYTSEPDPTWVRAVPLYASPIRDSAWVAEAMRLADEYAMKYRYAGNLSWSEIVYDVDAARAALERHLKGSDA